MGKVSVVVRAWARVRVRDRVAAAVEVVAHSSLAHKMERKWLGIHTHKD